MRIGCSTISFGPLPVQEALSRIADLGFSLVDIAAVPKIFEHILLVDPPEAQIDTIAAVLHERAMQLVAVPTVAWIPDALDDPDELRRRYSIAADAAAALRAKVWVVDAGQSSGGREKGLQRWRRTIDMAAELAAARGLRLAVEAPHAGTLATTLPEAIELLELADNPDLGVDYDTSHVHNGGASIAESIAALGPRIAHVALRDVVEAHHYAPPGEGVYDFRELLGALDRAGWDGDLMLELEPPEAESGADRRSDAAGRGKRHVEGLLAEMGLAEAP